MKKIHGIPCYFRKKEYLDAIQSTLDQIAAKCPEDLARIVSLVQAIRPYKGSKDGTMGQWGNGPYCIETEGTLFLATDLDPMELPATIAHEFGHAATTYDDIELRACPISDELTSEVCADMYAYKWGFGRQIAKGRKNRNWMHHGPAPGSSIEESCDGNTVRRYKLTRNFWWRLVVGDPVDTEGKR